MGRSDRPLVPVANFVVLEKDAVEHQEGPPPSASDQRKNLDVESLLVEKIAVAALVGILDDFAVAAAVASFASEPFDAVGRLVVEGWHTVVEVEAANVVEEPLFAASAEVEAVEDRGHRALRAEQEGRREARSRLALGTAAQTVAEDPSPLVVQPVVDSASRVPVVEACSLEQQLAAKVAEGPLAAGPVISVQLEPDGPSSVCEV